MKDINDVLPKVPNMKWGALMNKAPTNDKVEELNKIFTWIEQLDEVDVSNIEPLASVTGHSLPERMDEVTDGNYPDRVLSNAPDRASNFFTVPKVVE